MSEERNANEKRYESAANTIITIRCLTEAAMMVACAQILSYIKLPELPNGGSLTPAMFPIIFFAVRWGLKPGLLAGFAFGLLQLIFDGAYAWGWRGCSGEGSGAFSRAPWLAASAASWSTISAA